MPPAENKTAVPARQAFNRPPRIWTSPPQGKVIIPAPPAKDALPAMPGILSLLLPMLMVAMLIGIYMYVNHGSTEQLAFMLPIAVFSIMTPLATLLTAFSKKRAVKRKWKQSDKRYRQTLANLRTELVAKTNEQRDIAMLKDPDPTELEERIKQQFHLWERRPEDPDFLAPRVGRGTQSFSIELQLPEMDSADPLLPEVQQFSNDFQEVKDIPCGVSLTKVKSLGITGQRQTVADFARGLVCQIATLHSPEEVRIFGVFPASQKQDWEWMKDLPHAMPLKTGKLERLFAIGQEDAEVLLNVLLEELSQRASKNNEGEAPTSGTPVPPLPHLVVIVHDYIEVRKHPALTHAFKLGEQLGVSVIYLVAGEQDVPGECRGIIRLHDEQHLSYAAAGFAGETLEQVKPDIMELTTANKISRLLSPLHVAVEGEDAADLPTNVRLLDLLGLPFADRLKVEDWWKQPPFGRLRVPLGIGPNGPIWIDFNENAHGPHGIIAGTTGAGKSELLQSVITALAVTHHPHLVNFVLVDFKGGAAFKAFETMPHTVGMVTDLSGRLTERALVALKSELRRREHILNETNARNIAQYQVMRNSDPSALVPLPNLFIVIDEFAELAKEHPTFMDGLVSVVQKGRSLGVHLILATQKPTGSVNPNIWSNLKFRICLRVASLQDSRDMLGRSEAALLPSTIPGRAYFQIGSEIFELFQSARISLPARLSESSVLATQQATISPEELTDQHVLLDLMQPFREALSASLFRPWPAPLPPHITLPDLYSSDHKQHLYYTPGETRAADGVSSSIVSTPPYGWLTFPIGLVDRPVEQLQEPLLLDMPRQGGHILIAGASGSGKSIFLRTLITSLAQTHTPAQLHFYLIDYGGQALRVFEKLPHVGGVFGESDEEYIRRLLRKLQGMIDERKNICREYQIDDFLAYQRRRLDDETLPELPAVVLVIDKFIEFRQAYDKELDQILSIARFGRTYGVYMALTIDRPVALPSQLLSLIDLRFGLRLVELTDSLILLNKHDAAHIDSGIPGRGYKRGKASEEVQIALPAAGEDDDERAHQLEELVATIANEAEGPPAPPIRLLPEYVRIDDFLIEAAFSNPDARLSHTINLRIGIEDLSLQPIALELNADTPHMLVGGGPGSGRTGILQACLMVLASTPPCRAVRVILVDFRRTSRLLRRLPNIWMYADTEERLGEAINALKAELRERMARLREALEQQQEDNDELPDLDMPPLLLIIDDYDQLSTLTKNPLNDLKEFLLQARDLHLHIIVTGTTGDLGRSEILLQQVRACRLGVVLGGDPADSQLLGVRLGDLPPGRGYFVRRNTRNLVQFGHVDLQAHPQWLRNPKQYKPLDALGSLPENLSVEEMRELEPGIV